jgi:hypothetical protein
MSDTAKPALPCKHLNFELRPEDDMGLCTCIDCGMHLLLTKAFNGLQREMFNTYRELVRLTALFAKEN